ncbi:hypothetical protein PIROE2DRAFT_5005 [Piromyces sp. E2]|nr:hypothetical protein PIROE2DRAFT_5005 [Piromyces sp. E2]|eukprot:OUM67484.1 hypothetical protein PIROE2DRAFT_5005 [Piromyces sp. E2]
MSDLIIETKYGKVEGFVEDDVQRWYGIPYAKPPIDNLRFRRAVECQPWEGIKECKKFKGRCCQFKMVGRVTSMDSEDCLYLNIWRKIMVKKNYQYMCGFMEEAFDSNCYLSDEIMALKWFNENIEAFGGDVNNITINGESAGGTSVIALMSCPAAKGLFHKAIAQSAYPDGNHYPKSNKLLMDMFLEYLKISPEEAEKIRDLDYETLKAASSYVTKNLSRYPGIFWPSFVYDDLLPMDCYSTLKNGSAEGVKLIIGYNKNESTLFNIFHECPKNTNEIKKMLENNHLIEKYPEIEDFYFKQKKGGDSSAVLNFSGDYMFTLSNHEIAEIQSQKNDVWLYRFDYMPPMFKAIGMKATHGIDIPLTMANNDKVGSMFWMMTKPSSKKLLLDYIHGSWVRFAKTGNPNSDHLNYNWENYHSDSKKILLIDKEPKLVENLDKDKFELWKSIGVHQFYKD